MNDTEKFDGNRLLQVLGENLTRLSYSGKFHTRAEIMAAYDSLRKVFELYSPRFERIGAFLRIFNPLVNNLKAKTPDDGWLHNCLDQLRNPLFS